MSRQDREEIALLGTTGAGAVGTCRYKLADEQQEDFERIVEVMRAHDIGYFFYIGGNDSMDTAARVSRLARERGVDLVVTGVPKTIDNDIGDERFTIIDHTPGYGSAARYWATLIQNVNEENRGMCVSEPVAVLQAMGRKSGFITAASRLGDPRRECPAAVHGGGAPYPGKPSRKRESAAPTRRTVHRRGERRLRRGRRRGKARRVRPHRVRGESDHGGAGGRELPQRERARRARPGDRPGAGRHPAFRFDLRLHRGHRRGPRRGHGGGGHRDA